MRPNCAIVRAPVLLVSLAILFSPEGTLAQAEPRLEIFVFDQKGEGVIGRVFLIDDNNKRSRLADTDSRGMASAPYSRCKPEFRVVVEPRDVGYFHSTDEPCPEDKLRLEFQVYQRGMRALESKVAPAPVTTRSNVTAPESGTRELPNRNFGTNSKPLQM